MEHGRPYCRAWRTGNIRPCNIRIKTNVQDTEVKVRNNVQTLGIKCVRGGGGAIGEQRT